MNDRPVIGLFVALLVEACHWTRLRWEFDEGAIARGWQLSVIAIAIATILLWLEDRMTAVPQLLTWLPVLVLPMQFIQAYGLKDSLPLHTFSFFAKQRREHARQLGLQDSLIRFNFGNFYFAACLVAAALGTSANTWLNLAGLVLLSGWMLARYTRGGRLAFVIALLMAATIGFAGQLGISAAINHLRGEGRNSDFNPNFTRTRIGDMAEIKLSPEIKWRLRLEGEERPPALLRTAGYNGYGGGSWEKIAPVVPGVTDPDFQDLISIEPTIGEPYYLLRADADQRAIRPELARFNLRGAANEYTPMPLPGTAASLARFDLDGIERNSLGTVRMLPAKSIVNGTVLWQDSTNPEIPPMVTEKTGEDGEIQRSGVDLKVSVNEQIAISPLAKELGLTTASTMREKLRILQKWFNAEFAYSRYLSIDTNRRRGPGPTAIAEFLTETRSGHCEYFATAAVLLLREAGVPARYAVGYAVMEQDRPGGEWVIRGLHRHAWCRVWDEQAELWIDFDPTPPNWLAMETRRENSMQWLSDAFQRAREDFFIWRNEPRNRVAVFIVMGVIAFGVFLFVAQRLWKSRRLVHDTDVGKVDLGPPIRTPLHGLEPLVRKRIGPRRDGQTFAAWLATLGNFLSDPAPLEEAIVLHQQLRFDPAPPASSLSERLAELVVEIESALKVEVAEK